MSAELAAEVARLQRLLPHGILAIGLSEDATTVAITTAAGEYSLLVSSEYPRGDSHVYTPADDVLTLTR